ncbi:MAG: hypothetical protein CL607_25615 [Anaerolineaceae bacterium]|nr:hypothetical protein [Anaerolineaceae bacterium]
MAITAATFKRDRFTWVVYVLLGFFALIQSSLGPIMPYLREELDLSYTVGGMHVSAFAIGMVIASLTAARLTAKWGRRLLFWGGALGMVAGGAFISIGLIAPVTIFGAFLMGYLGSYLIVTIQAVLSDWHGIFRATALTEANIMASILAAISPVIVAFGATTPLTWRLIYIIAGLFWVMLYITQRSVPIPRSKQTQPENKEESGHLPRIFWLVWLVLSIGVAIEWSMIAWTADYLTTAANVTTESASAMVGIVLGAMVVGRVIASALTRKFSSRVLMWLAIATMGIGFPLLISQISEATTVIGLFLCGTGIANMFPLGLAIASDIGSEFPDLASSRISLAAGLAILLAPQLLGSLADQIGITAAYGYIGLLWVLFAATYAFAFVLNRPR